jgi:hypothetical protein
VTRNGAKRRSRSLLAGVIAGALGCAIGVADAQNPDRQVGENGGLNGSLSHADLQKLSGNRKQSEESSDTPAARAAAKVQVVPLIDSSRIRCAVNDARLVVSGSITTKGTHTVPTRVYEVACEADFGYLLEVSGSDRPLAISCLDAEIARAADVGKGREPGFFCRLPANADVYARVSNVIQTTAGAACRVDRLASFGHSESTKSEYAEVVCKEGVGYLVQSPLPGSSVTANAQSCRDAAKKGIRCRLTDPGPVDGPVTMDALKQAMAAHGEECPILQLRLIGQEDHRQRYVVEYVCAGAVSGKIAFVPMQNNSNPYESVECLKAGAIDLQCELKGSP